MGAAQGSRGSSGYISYHKVIINIDINHIAAGAPIAVEKCSAFSAQDRRAQRRGASRHRNENRVDADPFVTSGGWNGRGLYSHTVSTAVVALDPPCGRSMHAAPSTVHAAPCTGAKTAELRIGLRALALFTVFRKNVRPGLLALGRARNRRLSIVCTVRRR